MRYLTIDKCPHGTYSVSLMDDDGGVRLTPSKCCGRWDEIKRWSMTPKQLREMANELQCQADQQEN